MTRRRVAAAAAAVALLAAASADAATIRLHGDALRHGERASWIVTAGRIDAAAVRVRAEGCTSRASVALRAEGRTLVSWRSLGRRWTRRSRAIELPAGRHVLSVRIGRRPRGCVVRVRDVALTRPPPAAGRALPLGTAVRADALSAPGYRRAVVERFDAITTENELKWERVQPRPGSFSFAEPDRLVDFAARHAKAIRGHTLVYHDQLPGWVSRPDVPWTRERLLAVLEKHIKTVVGRYRGRIGAWDVVNEPLAADGSFRRSVWHDVIGPDYIDHALRWAHEADPEASLFVNETAAEHDNDKARALAALARRLVRRGVPLHGIGVQAHVPASSGLSREELIRVMGRYDALGLRVAVTELDVERVDSATERSQIALAGMIASACAAVARCAGVTAWGVDDAHSWLGRRAAGVLLDLSYRPKAAYTVVRDQLAIRARSEIRQSRDFRIALDRIPVRR